MTRAVESGRRPRGEGARLALKNALFTLVVPGTVGGVAPWWLAMRGDRVETPAWLSGPLFVAGLAIYGWCLWDFAAHGRGTPAPVDAPKRLVLRGLYRWTRNPMYVGVLTVLAGWFAFAPSVPVGAYAVLVALSFHTFVVRYEEPHLAAAFGEYAAYRARVPRWLPRLGRGARDGR